MKTYNLNGKLNSEKPTIVIGEKAYSVDDRQSTFMKMNDLLQKDSTNFEALFCLVFGEDNGHEIYNMDLSVSDTETLITAIFAAIKGITLEEAEETFRTNDK